MGGIYGFELGFLISSLNLGGLDGSFLVAG